MAELLKTRHFITADEYLEGEEISEIRHEYIDGEVHAMSGGTRNHNAIALNIAAALRNALRGGPCSAYIGDVKIRIRSLSRDSFYYPDVMVGCDPADNHELYLEKPTTVIEVLSESTRRIDLKEKFFAYKDIPSLQEYLIVSQWEKNVTLVRRAGDWQPESSQGDDFEITLPSLKATLTSAGIYEGVAF